MSLFIFCVFHLPYLSLSQFREDFNQTVREFNSNSIPEWLSITGDGEGIFTQKVDDGIATHGLDARNYRRNIWYAFTHRTVSLPLKFKPGEAPVTLYIEARVKPSHGSPPGKSISEIVIDSG